MNPANPQKPPAQNAGIPAQSPTQPANAPAGNLTPNLVGNIPVKAPDTPSTAKLDEDEELDKIMRDVDHELKREDRKPPKKRLGLFKAKAVQLSQPPPSTQLPPNPQPVQVKPPMPAQRKTKQTPTLAITMTIIVTGVLIAAAFLSYKK